MEIKMKLIQQRYPANFIINFVSKKIRKIKVKSWLENTNLRFIVNERIKRGNERNRGNTERNKEKIVVS